MNSNKLVLAQDICVNIGIVSDGEHEESPDDGETESNAGERSTGEGHRSPGGHNAQWPGTKVCSFVININLFLSIPAEKLTADIKQLVLPISPCNAMIFTYKKCHVRLSFTCN